MKIRILLTVGFLIFMLISISGHGANQNASTNEMISILSTPDLNELTGSLIQEYKKLHPNLKFETIQFNAQTLTSNLDDKAQIAFTSERSGVSFDDPSCLKMIFGRNVIVPVMNAGNPFITAIDQYGISLESFREAINTDKANWNVLIGNETNEALKIYVANDGAVRSALAEFLGLNPEILAYVETKPASEIIEIVQKNRFAIGICRLQNLTELKNSLADENLKLLPLDKNGNGQIDYHENIYGNLDNFKRGLWLGKYPGALINNIYVLSPTVTANENVSEFLNWLVTDGQQFMESGGYSELVYSERFSRLEKINPQKIALEVSPVNKAKSRTFLFIVLGLVVVVVIVRMLYRKWSKKVKMPLGTFSGRAKILSEKMLSFPQGLYFDKSHTWVFMEKEGTVKFGIDDFIPNVTGDYTRVIMKNPGEKVKRNESIITLIQKGKQINIHAPVSGTIKEINEALVADPFLINTSPYEDGWIYKIGPSNWLREIQFFKMGENYREWIINEVTRLKDFLACSFNIKNGIEGKLAFQEGGEMLVNPLQDLGPEIWEDFQSYFIETTDMY